MVKIDAAGESGETCTLDAFDLSSPMNLLFWLLIFGDDLLGDFHSV